MITGVAEIDRVLSRLPGQVQKELEKNLAEYAEGEADRIQAAAARVSKTAQLAARSVKARSIRQGGTIEAGGSQHVTGRATGADLFFGAEFGGGSRPATRQFKPYRQTGYWFFPQMRADEDVLDRMIAEAVDRAIEES